MKELLKKIGSALMTLLFFVQFGVNMALVVNQVKTNALVSENLGLLSYYIGQLGEDLNREKLLNEAQTKDILGLSEAVRENWELNATVLPKIVDVLKSFNDRIQYLEEEPFRTRIFEMSLQQTNVKIINYTVGCMGSGATIVHNGKYYVLSAGHLIDKQTDDVWLRENGEDICKLKVVKVDSMADLILFAPADENVVPKIYTTVATESPMPGEEVYICANPAGIEDVISKGRVIGYQLWFMYFVDHSYFGSSGGGLYNMQGEVVGIISHLIPISNKRGVSIDNVPSFLIHGAVCVNEIQAFLADVK
jgi:hypothetical protein